MFERDTTRRSILGDILASAAGMLLAGGMFLIPAGDAVASKGNGSVKPPPIVAKYGVKPPPPIVAKYGVKPPPPIVAKYGVKPPPWWSRGK